MTEQRETEQKETEPKECSVCYESFFLQLPRPLSISDTNAMDSAINDFFEFYNWKIPDDLEEDDDYNNIRKERRIRRRKLRSYYSRLYAPNIRKYKCSIQNCGVVLCDICFANIYYRSGKIIYQCSHCRNYDWKLYMTKIVFPQMICVSLSYLSPPKLRFPLRQLAAVF